MKIPRTWIASVDSSSSLSRPSATEITRMPVEVELSDDREHEVVVAGEPREVVDEDDVELAVVRR